jgi:hypothetical protein
MDFFLELFGTSELWTFLIPIPGFAEASFALGLDFFRFFGISFGSGVRVWTNNDLFDCFQVENLRYIALTKFYYFN